MWVADGLCVVVVAGVEVDDVVARVGTRRVERKRADAANVCMLATV